MRPRKCSTNSCRDGAEQWQLYSLDLSFVRGDSGCVRTIIPLTRWRTHHGHSAHRPACPPASAAAPTARPPLSVALTALHSSDIDLIRLKGIVDHDPSAVAATCSGLLTTGATSWRLLTESVPAARYIVVR